MATSPSIPVAMRTSCDAKGYDEATLAFLHWPASFLGYKDPWSYARLPPLLHALAQVPRAATLPT
eukprot:8882425-Heterocapsa_arctica.AAC.1